MKSAFETISIIFGLIANSFTDDKFESIHFKSSQNFHHHKSSLSKSFSVFYTQYIIS